MAQDIEAVKLFIEHHAAQVSTITTVSSAGAGVIILTLARMIGIRDDMDLSRFRKPLLLLIPFLLFVVSVILGYLMSSAVTAYFAEVAIGHEFGHTDKVIKDPSAYFLREYLDTLGSMGGWQLYLSMLGIVSVASWFVWNAAGHINKNGGGSE